MESNSFDQYTVQTANGDRILLEVPTVISYTDFDKLRKLLDVVELNVTYKVSWATNKIESKVPEKESTEEGGLQAITCACDTRYCQESER